MKLSALPGIACGVLPLVVVHLAYWMNIQAGIDLEPAAQCNPYIAGCVSTSGAVRSGPGIVPFKVVMLLVSVLMMITWVAARRWMVDRGKVGEPYAGVTRTVGVLGAIALVIYVTWLGTDGVIYGWLRRYGATVFFGCTALAQLLLTRSLIGLKQGPGSGRVSTLALVVGLQWLMGVAFVGKKLVLENQALIFRLENILEWWFVVAMSFGFILIGLVMGGGGAEREAHR